MRENVCLFQTKTVSSTKCVKCLSKAKAAPPANGLRPSAVYGEGRAISPSSACSNLVKRVRDFVKWDYERAGGNTYRPVATGQALDINASREGRSLMIADKPHDPVMATLLPQPRPTVINTGSSKAQTPAYGRSVICNCAAADLYWRGQPQSDGAGGNGHEFPIIRAGKRAQEDSSNAESWAHPYVPTFQTNVILSRLLCKTNFQLIQQKLSVRVAGFSRTPRCGSKHWLSAGAPAIAHLNQPSLLATYQYLHLCGRGQ